MCTNLCSTLVGAGVGIVGTITGTWLNYILSMRREYRIECGRFHTAFSEILSYLDSGNFNDAELFKRSNAVQEAAIITFALWLEPCKRPSFDDACKTYRRQRQFAQNQSELAQLAAQQANDLEQAIEKLLSYAK